MSIPVATPASISQADNITSLVIGLRGGGGKVREKHARDVTAKDLQREAAWIAGIADATEREAAIRQCLTSLLHSIQEGEAIGREFLEIAKQCNAAAKQMRALEAAPIRRNGTGPFRN